MQASSAIAGCVWSPTRVRLESVEDLRGGAIPGGLVPAVDKGVQEAMAEGVIAGYPMVDVKCTVFDGSYHRSIQRDGVQDGGAYRLPCSMRTGGPVVLRAHGER